MHYPSQCRDRGGSILASSPHVVTFGYGRTNDLWPFTLLDGARSFVAVADAAVVRLGRPDAGGPHYLTILFLLSQAIENALKSNLLFRGVTDDELMKIGHDLPRVLVRTERAGCPTQHPADHFLLKVIDGCYRHQKQLQYPIAISPCARNDAAAAAPSSGIGARVHWPTPA